MLGDQGPPAHESLTTESCLVVAHADSCSCSDESNDRRSSWIDDEDNVSICDDISYDQVSFYVREFKLLHFAGADHRA